MTTNKPAFRLVLSVIYFALILASYYMIRPLRDAFAAGSGSETIKYLALAVLISMAILVPVFGWIVANMHRTRLLSLTYGFFALNLVAFGAIFYFDPENVWAGRLFYVWTTVFNLFVVSVFWSFMSEIWQETDGRRFFGVIAAGGSFGGLLGPLLTKALVGTVGIAGIAFIAAGLLACTIVVILLLTQEKSEPTLAAPKLKQAVGGNMFAGLSLLLRSPFLLGIAALMIAGSLLGMFVYIEMARLVEATYATAAERAAFFAQRDFWVNSISLVLQLLIVGKLTSTFGVRTTLTASVLLIVASFAALAVSPTLAVLAIINIVMRANEFGLAKPSRDMLYTVVDLESKYKVKNVIDTVIYRASDFTSSWLHAALIGLGATLGVLGLISMVLSAFFAWIAFAVGTGYRRRGGF